MFAGGQASRLRLDGPKGTYPIGPRTDRSLFRILVEQLVRAGRDFGTCPPLAVTTSASTDAAIRAFFEAQDCFGMDRGRLRFACQGSLPAFDRMQRLVLAGPGRIFRNPDGHGGAIAALESSGILTDWAAAGIEAICTFQVDNPLLKVVDTDFIGRLWTEKPPIVTKVVRKTDPTEKVGVVACVKGLPSIVEYSEIGAHANARDPDGQLTFRLGSIAVHAFDLEFLAGALKTPLPLHRANKEIPGIDEQNNPARIPGVKFERFVFDLFPLADGLTVVETLREREYAPVKNAEGQDSPATVRAALDAEYRRWYEEAGAAPPEGSEPLELSPLDALGPQDVTDPTAC